MSSRPLNRPNRALTKFRLTCLLRYGFDSYASGGADGSHDFGGPLAAGSKAATTEGSGGGASDEPPSGTEAAGHEFRIPMKGVTGRLPQLACFKELVVLNLSGTAVAGDIAVLGTLANLEVSDLK